MAITLTRRGGRLTKHGTEQDRAVWAAAAALLDYPDERLTERLAAVERLWEFLPEKAKPGLQQALDYLRSAPDAEQEYVSTFDMRRRATLYLTYWSAGDTRNRGQEIHRFLEIYRESGVEPPQDESPDHLTVVLEFAAQVDPDAGRALLGENRAGLELVRSTLREAGSPYAGVIDAICESLGPMRDSEIERAKRLAQAGPPKEAVGLEPFQLTVPPRRKKAAGA